MGGKKSFKCKRETAKKAGKKFKIKKDNGAEIQTWTVDGKGVPEWQQWKLIIIDTHTVIFETVFTGKAIDIKNGGYSIKKNGTKLISYIEK